MNRDSGEFVIHATGGPSCDPRRSFKSGTLNGIVRYFKSQQHRISIHYVVGRDGTVVQMVPEHQVAWHVRELNETSIGIELINNGDGNDPLTIGAIKGHFELDNTQFTCRGKRIKRKQDPGRNFPWESMRSRLARRIRVR